MIPMISPAADSADFLFWAAICCALVGFIGSGLAIWLCVRVRRMRARHADERRQFDAAQTLREALLAGMGESVMLVPGSGTEFSSGHAPALLSACLEGPDAKRLVASMDALVRTEAPFEAVVRTPSAESVSVRGAAIGGRPAIFLRNLGAIDVNIDFRAVLESLPMPVWIRGEDLSLRWANAAFLEATGNARLPQAVAAQAVIERSELELAVTARDSGTPVEANRYTMIAGKRRALSISMARLRDRSVMAVARDITDVAQAEAKLKLNLEAAADLLDGIPSAIATIAADMRVTTANSAFATLWGLEESFLETRPSLSDVIERLRESRQLPEQMDFPAWKAEFLAKLETCRERSEEQWYLPGGRSVRIVIHPHLLGGVYLVIEDISERLGLESAYRLLSQVQRATLDAMDDGIAIFGPDSRIVLHNRAFASLWQLGEDALSSHPSIAGIARLVQAKFGADSIWNMVLAGATAEEPERCNDWGRIVRADGRVLSLTMSRLPNGATMATFADVTDLERFEELKRESNHAA